jgi:zinc/manganese transport system permease protein
MLEYDFMRMAVAAGTVVAIVVSVVGYFLVLRHLAFAGHALSHVGFAGAAGAALMGAPPFWGVLGLTFAAAVVMGLLGDELRRRDIAVGVVLTFALGCGVLFLHYYTGHATQATTILFGNLLAVNADDLVRLAMLAVVTLVALAVLARPLLFATLAPELAGAKGVPVKLVSVLFLVIVAAAVAEATQVVGALLVFALLVIPAAAAIRVTTRVVTGVGLTVALALVETWSGMALGYALDWPITFCIVLSATLLYAGSVLPGMVRSRMWCRATASWPHAAENRSRAK